MGGMTDWVDRGRLRFEVLSGASANTNIAVSGITTKDVIVFCLELATAASIATCANRTATTNITSDGYIQCTDDTSSDSLVLLWLDRE